MVWEKESLVDLVESFHQGLNTAGEKIKFMDFGFPIIQTRNINNGAINLDNKIKFMSQSDWDKYKDKYRPAIDDVFFTNIGTIGKTAIVRKEDDYLIHWNIFKIRPLKNKIDSAYLKGYLDYLTNIGYFSNSQKGGTVNFVTKKMMGNVEIPLPSITEQKRIVAILDQAFADIDKARATAERNLKNARELFDSYLQQVFSKRGEGWVDLLLEDVCSFKHGFAFKSEFFTDNPGLNLLTPGNFFEEGGYKDRGEKQKYYDGPFPKEFLLTEGSLLVAMTEQAAGLLGSPALVPDDDIFLHNQRLGLVEVTPEFENRVSMKFLFHLFNTKYFRAKVQETATGLKVRHTSPKKMQAIPVSLPSDVNEQDSIARKLFELKEQSTKLEAIYKRKFLHLDELKKSILQKAFTGELTKSKGIAA
jgi:type I restriction enzyme S subunit